MPEVFVPTPSSIVHYTLWLPSGALVTRPAIVIDYTAGRTPGVMPLLDLQALTNGARDGVRNDGSFTGVLAYPDQLVGAVRRAHNTVWCTGVRYSARVLPNTWRWPPPVPLESVEIPD